MPHTDTYESENGATLKFDTALITSKRSDNSVNSDDTDESGNPNDDSIETLIRPVEISSDEPLEGGVEGESDDNFDARPSNPLKLVRHKSDESLTEVDNPDFYEMEPDTADTADKLDEETQKLDKIYDDLKEISEAKKYQWSGAIPVVQPAKKIESKSESVDLEQEFEEFEIGGNALALKILMSVILIISIVIISALVYKLNELNNRLQTVQSQLDVAPTISDLETAYSIAQEKDKRIAELETELNEYKLEEAANGDLINTPEGQVYVVSEGDLLSTIARTFDVTLGELMKWNNLDNADEIKIGQKIIVRVPEAEEPTE
ncbi:MAG: LysM peptidoglycan-binding domain-containing protein [Clostridiales bacterium]|jgi:LysM repeat protein|nr:LysM peptidoglycan-binding domain-containing protein [Clostridiales bacterium]